MLAYQGYGSGIDRNLILNLTREFTDEQYIHPDFTVILSLKNEAERMGRIRRREEPTAPDMFESRDEAFLAAVEQGYLAIAEEYKIPVISASLPKEIIASEIYQYISNLT